MAETMPPLEFKRAPCPKCSARTVKQAEARCQPTRDHTDEWTCPGGENEDAQGFLRRPSAASIKRMDAWIDCQRATPPTPAAGSPAHPKEEKE